MGRWGGLTPLLMPYGKVTRTRRRPSWTAGADLDRPSTGDGTTPLLMAALNGQFDLAGVLLERGANPNLASAAGVTPLFATLERTWAPKSSYAHPVEHQQQETTHIELLEALLRAGANPNARLDRHLWVHRVHLWRASRRGDPPRGSDSLLASGATLWTSTPCAS